MISGHALEGVMAGCAVFAGLETSLTPDAMRALQQWTVDIGDRRVMAGVHYPTDSFASWIVALDMADRVFPGGSVKSVRRFLAAAIRERSHVYAYMKERIDNDATARDGGCAYTSSWTCLSAALDQALSET